jgi:high-affinity nickel permease
MFDENRWSDLEIGKPTLEIVSGWDIVWFWLVASMLFRRLLKPLGFDTASSIALLAISAIAQRGPNGEGISHGKIVVLPVSSKTFVLGMR